MTSKTLPWAILLVIMGWYIDTHSFKSVSDFISPCFPYIFNYWDKFEHFVHTKPWTTMAITLGFFTVCIANVSKE